MQLQAKARRLCRRYLLRATRAFPSGVRLGATVAASFTRMNTRTFVISLALVLAGRIAAAQVLEAPETEPRFYAGPLRLFPAITARDIGIDSNVYNDQAPREDFTYTISPFLRAVLPIRDARLTTRGSLDFRFFEKLKDQQSIDSSLNTELDTRNGRVRPFGTAGFVQSHERGGYDIDARAASVLTRARLGARVALTPVTSLTGWVVRETMTYSPRESVDGVALDEQLDHVTRGAATGLRFDLTPFTSITSAIEVEKTRFKYIPLRDANSFRFAPVVRFAEGAIIEGEASAGFRDFRPLDARLAQYRGFVARVKLGVTIARSTRAEGEVARDVEFSYVDREPLYLLTGGRIHVAHRITGPLEAIAIGGRYRLQYQNIAEPSFDGRVEHVTIAGGGIGFIVNEHLRVTFTTDREQRISTAGVRRDYERRRMLGSVSYIP